MANVIIDDTHLTDIAEAIRRKRGTTATYKPKNMASAISLIPTGGSSSGGIGEFSYEIVSWANGTDEQIVRMIQAADLGLINLADYWSVGDEREFTYTYLHYNEELEKMTTKEIKMKMILMDNQQSNLDLYELVSPTPSGRITGSFIIGFNEVLPPNGDGNRYGINNVGSNPSTVEFGDWWQRLPAHRDAYSYADTTLWSVSQTRNVLSGRFAYEVPQLFRQIVKPVRVLSYNPNYEQQTSTGSYYIAGNPLFYASFDTWFIPSISEICGSNIEFAYHDFFAYERRYFKQYQYYLQDSNQIIKTSEGVNKDWWSRSPVKNSTTGYLYQYRIASDGTPTMSGAYDNDNVKNTFTRSYICPHAVI